MMHQTQNMMHQNDKDVQKVYFEEMSVFFEYLNQRHFASEKAQGGFIKPSKIKSDIVSPIEVPELLGKLITKNDERSKHYLSNIRSYLY